MLDEIISYHRYTVEFLLLVLLVNLLLPSLLRRDVARMVFWSRVGYFAFWMSWSMVVFAGLILFMFTGRALTLPVDAMLAASVLLGVMDGYRAFRSKKQWLKGLDAYRFSAAMIGGEIAVLVLVSLYAIAAH